MSPKSPEEFEKTRRQSQRKILEAAFDVFAHQGYSSASMANIAKQAGVSKGLIYNYFASKEELVEAVIFHHITEMFKILITPVFSLPPKERIREFIVLSLSPEMWGQDTSYFRSYTALVMNPDIPEPIRNKLAGESEQLLQMMIQLFKEAEYPNPEDSATLLAALLDGIQFHFMVMTDRYPMQQMRKRVLKHFGYDENSKSVHPAYDEICKKGLMQYVKDLHQSHEGEQ